MIATDGAAGLDRDLSFLPPPGELVDWRLVLAYEAAAGAGVLDALPGTVGEIAARCDSHEGALRAVLGQLAVWEVVVADREAATGLVRRRRRGRPRTRPDRVVADKAYSHPSTRAALRERRVPFTCPERADQIERRRVKGSRGGRPPAFDQAIYAGRNVVERCFNRLKQFRGLATRYAKRAAYYRAEIIIAAIMLWLRTDLQNTP